MTLFYIGASIQAKERRGHMSYPSGLCSLSGQLEETSLAQGRADSSDAFMLNTSLKEA